MNLSLRHRSGVRLPVVVLRHRAISPQDVFVLSYPRSGNTWMRYMLASLVCGQEADPETLRSLIPPVGRHRDIPAMLPDGGRLIKSHERRAAPYASTYRRAVYLVRDGRDVAVSYYDWHVSRGYNVGDFANFLSRFLSGTLDGYGRWHEHVRSWLMSPLMQANSLLVIRYEDLRERPEENLARVAEFIGLNVTHEQVEEAVSRNTVERTQARSQHQRLPWSGDLGIAQVARGSSEKWKLVFSSEDVRRFENAAGGVLTELGYRPTLEGAERS
jgi:hypothetical protein